MADLSILLVHGCISTSLCIAFAGYVFSSRSESNQLSIFKEYPFQFVFMAAIFFLFSWGSAIANEFVLNNIILDIITKMLVSLGWTFFLLSFLLFIQLYKDRILIYFQRP
jgi:hypothetical protein